MIRNFVGTSDLAKYDVAIGSYLPEGQEDWSAQIDEAFEQIKDRLRQKNIVSRLMGLPIDLNRGTEMQSGENLLVELTKTGSYTGVHVKGMDGFRRFAVNISVMTGSGSFSFSLQGSNDVDVKDSEEPENWVTIQTLAVSSIGEHCFVFQDEFKYYRLVLSITGTDSSVTYQAGIYETYQDRWVIWLSLSLIYRMISKGVDDAWLRKAQDAFAMFENSFESYPFVYDLNGDNIPESTELHSATIRFFR